MLRARLICVKARRLALSKHALFLCQIEVEQKLCHCVHFPLKLAHLRFVVILAQWAEEILELVSILHRGSLASSGNSRKVREVAFGTTLKGAVRNHWVIARDAYSFVFYLGLCGATIIGMSWLSILIRTIIDWLRELPPDLLGRKVERLLDRCAGHRRRGRAPRGRKAGSRKQRR
jgi:hypothetical protein